MRKFLLLIFMFVFVLSGKDALAQGKTVSGTVTSEEDGSALPGVNVVLKGTTTGTVTDINGAFRLNMPEENGTLVFSFIGLTTKEVEVGSRSVVNVEMSSDVTELTEVVVTAGGVEARKKEIGYSATTLKTDDITKAKPVNAAQGLTGKVAGLQINTISSGVNPNVRVVLRGNRSLTGNNEALIVIDNVIVPNDVLSTLNPQDIEEMTVLNGATAAALYGSAASNGALVITTKGGQAGKPKISISHTVNVERVSFYPEMQTQFGSGTAGGYPTQYVAYENQQYGPAFDGSLRPIGRPLEDGSVQEVVYSPTNDKEDFWDTGVTNQTDFSISGGTDKSQTYFSVQYLKTNGTTPEDEYTRASFRLNGSQDFTDNLTLSYNTSYIRNKYDITTATATIYDNLLQTPAQIPLTQYEDWENDPFANPNGYYNEYYDNPYWTIDNNREDRKDNYFIGNLQLKYDPLKWLGVTYRIGVTSRNRTSKYKYGSFTFSDYTKSVSSAKTDIVGGMSDYSFTTSQAISDLQLLFKKSAGDDWFFSFLAGNTIRINQSKAMNISGEGLVTPGLYNISNRLGQPSASESNYEARQVGTYGQLKIAFKDYLFLTATGRNDWVSILAPDNRSFFYPSVALSYVASDAIPIISESSVINQLKLRASWSKVGQVNLGNESNFGAYALSSTFGPSNGFPYGSLAGYVLNDQIVSPSLKPEMTTGYEAGVDFSVLDNRVSGSATWYKTSTTDQTVATGVSTTTGFSSYLQNTGEVGNEGIEALLNVVAYKSDNIEVNVGANYTYNDNWVESISGDLTRLQLSSGGQAQVYAVEGEPFPVLLGTTYERDDQGRVIVDAETGYPSTSDDLVNLGNTVPKHRLGLTGGLSYKNFSLSFLFEYRGGYNILYNGGSSYDFSGSAITTAYYNRERFVFPNSVYEDPENPGSYIENTNITIEDGGSTFWSSGSYRRNVADNYVVSGDYWKLREVAITYNLPASVLAKTKVVKSASLTLQGRNLFLWTPKSNIYTDPDFNFNEGNAIGIVTLSSTPPTRFYGATLSLTF
ncbi:SusC/RagA family TonB-linked outer membrane protein [Fulvivirga maritima]|uniref:SusC/RagA family TonB-linked outer membrane protein n=1 Tax=Fulvivirga maritima TaxID=2904247 RepID=UPI001F2C42C3|nr:SusC/RagA family TonB-linked outer membrane protein [Fulvivirga maritima]UII27079.1 SusC/RagA family TonB-linked outer membrane protein [Fulvivirga maritima]